MIELFPSVLAQIAAFVVAEQTQQLKLQLEWPGLIGFQAAKTVRLSEAWSILEGLRQNLKLLHCLGKILKIPNIPDEKFHKYQSGNKCRHGHGGGSGGPVCARLSV